MAGQRYTLTFDASLNVNQIKNALQEVQKNLSSLNLPSNATKGFTSVFQKLSEEIKNFEALSNKDITSKADFSKIEKSAERIGTLFSKLNVELNELSSKTGKDFSKLLPEKTTKNIQDATKALDDYKKKTDELDSSIQSKTKLLEDLQASLKKVSEQPIWGQKQKNEFNSVGNQIKEKKKEIDDLNKKIDEYNNNRAGGPIAKANWRRSPQLKQYLDDIKAAEKAIEQLEQQKDKLSQTKGISITPENQAKQIQDFNTKIQEATQALANFEQQKKELGNGDFQQLAQQLSQLTGLDISTFGDNAEQAGKALQNYLNKELEKLRGGLGGVGGSLDDTSTHIQSLKDQIIQAGQELSNFDNRLGEIKQLKSRIQYFFGLNNTIQLVKRTMRDAYETIKSLDKAMTETAVVTDFSVGDMWAQLPEYTKRANELGVTTQAAYEAATLYYQQGLSTNEVMAMSNETLKMARIAGLDAAEATDRMTNAIRGFNMEINEMNAQRIDDVYSRLAAISASDVDEISIAMTKVASLAHNANMEFETTAAFLAQIIETTRESPETAGTALKTVVARFSEVKKLVDEGTLRGEDEEGQVVDVNKVSSALRTAGIDLNKYFLGEVGLDDIFMELASKWDSLTTIQQRYIATQAAGSRQQSRFIALMSDYARTQELVGEAYNANGAAAKQFEKTQESLESKLARLKNAWDEFTMGILNSDVVKGIVDGLTLFLNFINQLTSGFGTLNSGIGGVLNSLLKLGTLLGGLKLGKGLLSGIFGSGLNTITGGKVGGTFGSIFTQSIGGGLSGKLIGRALAGRAGASLTEIIASGEMAAWLPTAGSVLPLLGAIGGIAAAAGVAYIAIKKLYDASPAGQVKIAEKYAKSLEKVADSAKKAKAEAEQAIEDYSKYDSAISEATTTKERTAAIKDRNEYITSLLEQNAAYAKYVTTTFENGEILLTLDSDALAAAVDKIAEGAIRAEINSDFAQAMLAGNQANYYRNILHGESREVDLENKLITEKRTVPSGFHTVHEESTRSLTPDEIKEYARYQVELEKKEASAQNYAQLAIAKLIDTDQISDETASVFAEYAAKKFSATDFSDQVAAKKSNNWWGSKATDQSLRLAYESLYGYAPDSSLKKDELEEAVALAEVVENSFETQAEDFQQLLSSDKGELYTSILAAATGKGAITQVDFTKSSDFVSDALKAYGLDSKAAAEAITELEQAAGLAAGTLEKDITEQGEFIKNLQKVNKSKLLDNFSKIGITGRENWIDLQTPRITEQLLNITAQVQGRMTADQQRAFFEGDERLGIAGILNETDMTLTDLQEIFDFLSSVNLSQPIDAFEKLSSSVVSSNKYIAALAKYIRVTNSELSDSSYLLRSFLMSDSYDNIASQLEDLIKTNEKLGAADIEELAKNCKDLDALLQNNIVSAEGLAKALTLVSTGKIGIEQISESVLEAIERSQSLEDSIYKVQKAFSEFNAGPNFGEGLKLAAEKMERLQELLDSNKFGTETQKTYDLLFGEGSFQAVWDANAEDQARDIIKQNVEQMSSWIESGGYEFFNDDTVAGLLGITNLGDYILDWDLTSYKDFNDLISKVQEAAEAAGVTLSDTMARSLVLGYIDEANSPETQKAFEQLMEKISLTVENIRKDPTFGGHVDLTKQPLLDAQLLKDAGWAGIEEDIATLYTRTYSNTQGTIAMNFTPIITDENGNYIGALSPEQLQTYAEEVINGTREDDLNLKVGYTFTSEEEDGATKKAVEFADDLQALQKELYNINDTTIPKVTSGAIFGSIEDAYKAAGVTVETSETPALDTNTAYVDTNTTQTEINTAALEKGTVALEKGTTAIENLTDAMAEKDKESENDSDDKESKNGFDEFVKKVGPYAMAFLDLIGGANRKYTGPEGGPLSEIGKINVDFDLNNTKNSTSTAVQEGVTEGGAAGAATLSNEIQSELDKTPFKLKFIGSGFFGGLGGLLLGGGSRAAGGSIKKPQESLTGEEGAEVVWNKEKGYSYIAGANGPEFNTLYPGDRVFNANETREILRHSNSRIRKFLSNAGEGKKSPALLEVETVANKITSALKNASAQFGDYRNKKTSGGSGGGGSSKVKDDEWKNTLDWLYNLMEDIAELERIQTILSDKHDRYLEDIFKTGRDLYKITNDQLNNLYTQRDNYQEAVTRRLQEMREQITENELSNYVWWNGQDNTIEIDWDAINEITDKDQFEKVSDLVSKAEKIQDQIDEAQDALWEIEGQIDELEKRYLQEFIDLQKRVYDAVVNSYQQQIDALSSLNETINESNDKVLNSLQKEIELQRQIRDNTDTEKNIQEMEARLAFLRRDTTGANDAEIRSLEKQLEEARRDYADTLIDQAIDKLQESNSEASEERQKQIELLTEQLDYWKEIGALWPEVARLLDEGINGEGSLIRGSTLEKILQEAEGWKAMSEQQREVWSNELITAVNQAGAYIIKMSEGFESLSEGIWALIPESSIPAGERKYATGGLVTSTGHAWLDGTRAEPEYVLNARQTDAFLKLAEVLPSMFNGNGSVTNNLGGNVYVELNMSVGEIGSDYDVDRLVERVKEDIYNAGSYRNVNAVSFMR